MHVISIAGKILDARMLSGVTAERSQLPEIEWLVLVISTERDKVLKKREEEKYSNEGFLFRILSALFTY